MEQDQPQSLEGDPPIQVPPRPPNWGKRIAGLVIGAMLVTALCIWLKSDAAQKIRSNPLAFFEPYKPILARHPLLAPAVFISLYVAAGVTALPVWPLQMFAGLGFGLFEGTLFCLIGSTIGAVITVALSRWIASDFVHERIEARVEQLRKLEETLGHNGFLVVMTVRLVHMLPFGLCNYALGLTLVSYIDVLLGTFLGGIPADMFYVSWFTPYNPLTNWRFDMVVAGINAVLLLPLIMRYVRPQWFKRIGVE